MTQWELRGRLAYHAGCSAEDRVAQDYERRGYAVAVRRWRGAGGEIDLVVRDSDGVVFVEVKQSRSFNRAAERLGQRQMKRIAYAAAQFLAGEPDGQLTNVRFDAALVDHSGAVQIIENAFGQA